MTNLLEELKDYAKENHVPIILDDGLEFLLKVIKEKNPKSILEIGCAIGYSSINMALNTNASITTIERDSKMYEEAIKNIDKANLNDRIRVIFKDALEVDEEIKDEKYDVIFIDAAKSQYIKFFEKYSKYLNDDGIILTDNMNFHGVTVETATSRNLKALIRKLNNYHKFLEDNQEFESTVYNIGDGIAVSKRRK